MAKPIIIQAPISVGELLDKITILEIKRERITQTEKLKNINAELSALTDLRAAVIPASIPIKHLEAELKTVNDRLWNVEDEIRLCEGEQKLGPRFISLARSVYFHNDRRSSLKRSINEETRSEIIEEKSYKSTT